MAARKLLIKIEDLVTVDALTENQKKFFKAYKEYPVTILHGVAGTGKTFIALYKALEEVLDKGTPCNKVIVIRSPIETGKSLGALPGDLEEKSDPFQDIYYSLCSDLFESGDAYRRLKEQRKLSFNFTTHLRGITFDNAIIIVDEIQNLTYQELSTTITRVGENSRILFCGDTKQNDLNGKSGLDRFMRVVDNMPSSTHIEFGIDDIVRSDLIREFLISEMKTI